MKIKTFLVFDSSKIQTYLKSTVQYSYLLKCFKCDVVIANSLRLGFM